MYRFLLTEPVLANSLNFPIVGWLKYEGPAPGYFPAWSKWHYVGTFFWFRAADVFNRAWWYITPARYGAEAYPSSLFESKHAAAGFTVNPQQHFLPSGVAQIYTMDFWTAIGIPQGPDGESYDGSPV